MSWQPPQQEEADLVTAQPTKDERGDDYPALPGAEGEPTPAQLPHGPSTPREEAQVVAALWLLTVPCSGFCRESILTTAKPLRPPSDPRNQPTTKCNGALPTRSLPRWMDPSSTTEARNSDLSDQL